MSLQNVQAFWQKAQKDPALRQKLKEIKADGMQAVAAAVVRIAAEAGFAFTASEYQTAVKEELARRHAAGELAEADLSSVAGGSKHTLICTDSICMKG